MDIDDILNGLEVVRKKDFQESLFYSWELLPKEIQREFISWCEEYMQVSHAKCSSGWEGGWQKYHKDYIQWLNNEKGEL